VLGYGDNVGVVEYPCFGILVLNIVVVVENVAVLTGHSLELDALV
jgi:hypothetical protein